MNPADANVTFDLHWKQYVSVPQLGAWKAKSESPTCKYQPLGTSHSQTALHVNTLCKFTLPLTTFVKTMTDTPSLHELQYPHDIHRIYPIFPPLNFHFKISCVGHLWCLLTFDQQQKTKKHLVLIWRHHSTSMEPHVTFLEVLCSQATPEAHSHNSQLHNYFDFSFLKINWRETAITLIRISIFHYPNLNDFLIMGEYCCYWIVKFMENNPLLYLLFVTVMFKVVFRGSLY